MRLPHPIDRVAWYSRRCARNDTFDRFLIALSDSLAE
jgi:hypothetical protein